MKTVTPADGPTRVPRAADITATFSEKMDPATLTTEAGYFKLCKVTAKGTTQITDVTVTPPSGEDLTATLKPNKLLENTTYQAVVSTGAEDLADNALDQSPSADGKQPMKWSFKTGSS